MGPKKFALAEKIWEETGPGPLFFADRRAREMVHHSLLVSVHPVAVSDYSTLQTLFGNWRRRDKKATLTIGKPFYSKDSSPGFSLTGSIAINFFLKKNVSI